MNDRLKNLIGSRVRITGITDPCDADLNGRQGILCRPFRDQRPIQECGIKLDPNGSGKEEFANVYGNEFEVIEQY